MILGIGRETEVFLYAMLSGVTVVLVYRILTALRQMINCGPVLLGITDLVFWIWVSSYIFKRMYDTTYGEVRWFFLLGTGAGAVLCRGMISAAEKISAKGKKSLEKYKKNR